MKKIVLLVVYLILVQGCVYPISKDLVDKTDKTVTFEMLQADPDQYKGKLVILGGSITAVTGSEEGSLIDIDQLPLDYWGKPIRANRASGRFLVYTLIYLNSYIYTPGSLITVAGEIEGTSLKLPGKTEPAKYAYPVLVAKELKLWPKKRRPEEPNWWDPLWDPLSPMSYPIQ
jgi:starvation-inducible outer membrane lipoprotein